MLQSILYNVFVAKVIGIFSWIILIQSINNFVTSGFYKYVLPRKSSAEK